MKTAKKIYAFVLCITIIMSSITGFASVANPESENYVREADLTQAYDLYAFEGNTSYTAIVSREYDFSGNKYFTEVGIGGGFVNGNNVAYTWNVDGTAEFAYKDQPINNFYMRGTMSDAISYGTLGVTYRMKLMQTNETVNFGYETRTQDTGAVTHTIKVFGNDGKIAATDVEYEADTWYNITIEFNTAAGTADVYVDNVYAGTSTYTQNHGVRGIIIYMPFNNSDTKYVFDHFKAITYAPNYTFAASTITSDGETEGLDAFPIDGASAKIVFSEAISELRDGDVLLVSNGKNVAIDCELNENVLVITPKQKLSPRAKCTLSFPGVTTVLGGVAADADKINFSVSISDFSIESYSQITSESDNVLTLDVLVQNKMQISNDVALLCTLLRDGKMMSVTSVRDQLLPESKNQDPYTLRLKLPEDYDESTDTLTLYLVNPDKGYAYDEIVVVCD